MSHKASNDNPQPASEAAEKNLRQRAEELARKNASPTLDELAKSSPESFAEMLHELQVHQIELELQNEELRQTQFDLQESRRRYFDLYDLAPVGYLTLNEAGIVEEANLTAAEMLGITRADLVKRPFSYFIIPNDQDTYYLQHKQLITIGEAVGVDLRLKGNDHPPLWVSLKRTVASNQQGSWLVINDITNRKMAETALQASYKRLEETLAHLKSTQDQLVHQERLAAIGQLSTGLAHDFNNILAIIILEAELCKKQVTQGVYHHQAKLQTIIEQANNAAALIQQILDFSRRALIQPKAIEIASFLEEQADLLQHTLQENIQINLTLPSHPCAIFADENQLRQLILNLAMNARDAMPKGGDLSFSVQLLQKGTPLALPEMPAGDWVQLTVKDTGTGIPLHVLPNIFEPYFTTKQHGKGTGLGLAQVQGIVKQNKGFIEVKSIVGEGSTFTVFLPAAIVFDQESAQLPLDTVKLPLGDGELVLLVENNAILSEALASTLEALNYEPITAVNGFAALEILEKRSDEVAVIVSDLTMPGMGGESLFQTLQQQKSTIPMIMMSGNPVEASAAQKLVATGLSGFLVKPIRLQDLASVLAQALQRRG